MVAVSNGRGTSLLELRVGLRAREVLSCEKSVNFRFKDLHSISQNERFGGKFTQLGVFEGKFLLANGEGTLGQLKVKTALGQSRP